MLSWSLSHCALCLTLFLCGYSLAQDTVIEVGFDNIPHEENMDVVITVPNVSRVVFVSSVGISFNSDGQQACLEGQGGPHPNCTLVLNQNMPVYHLVLESRFNGSDMQNIAVSVNVNSNYTSGCSPYVFPVRLNITEMSGGITCVPVFVNSSLSTSSVQWYSSLTMDGENLTRVSDSRVNFASSRGVVNASVIFRMADEEDAAYYFPITEAVGLDRLSEIPPILVTYRPIIASALAEFSRDLYIDPNVPQNTTFSCRVRSFPPASVIWRLYNTSMPGNVTLMCTPSQCIEEMSRANLPNEYYYNVTILNVDFSDSGIYSCFPENDAFKAAVDDSAANHAHSYHLRVKDHLRPLWPAIGTLVVPFVLIALMLVGTLWDKMIAKFCVGENSSLSSKAENRRIRSSTSNSSDSPDGIKLTEGHAALRRLSSGKVQLLEEPGNA